MENQQVIQFPASITQRSLWLLDSLTKGSGVYYETRVFSITGDFRLDVFKASLLEITKRHEILRTNFEFKGEACIQKIKVNPDIDLEVLELTSMKEILEELIKVNAHRNFDLLTDRLIRYRVYQESKSSYYLQVVVHHIIADEWSFRLFINELNLTYNSLREQKRPQLPTLEIQYLDFTGWQNKWFESNAFNKQLDFWRTNLSDAPDVSRLPVDLQTDSRAQFDGAVKLYAIEPASYHRIKEFSRSNRVTPFMTLLSSFAALFYEITGQSDMIFGTPIAGRTQRELEPLIGCFINGLPIRIRFKQNMDFHALLQYVRKAISNLITYQQVPQESIAELKEGASGALFQTMLLFTREDDIASLDFDGLQVTPVPFVNQTAKFDLSLAFIESGSGLNIEFRYKTGLYREETIETIANKLLAGITGYIADPQMILPGPASIISNPGSVISDKNTVLEWFESGKSKRRDAIALVCGDRQLTYAELTDKAASLSAYLIDEHNVNKHHTVAIAVSRSVDWFVGMLAVMKTGATYVPVDPDYPHERKLHMFQSTNCKLVLTDGELGEIPPEIHVIDLREHRNATGVDPIVDKLDPKDALYCIFTSGTTGRPKGVLVSNSAVVNLCSWLGDLIYEKGPDQLNVLLTSSLGFDGSVKQIFPALLNARTLIISSPEQRRELPRLLRLIEDKKIYLFDVTPSYLKAILTAIPDGKTFLSVKYVLIGGEKLDSQLIRDFYDSFPNAQLINVYGVTEATVDSTFHFVDRNGEADPNMIGKPIHSTKVKILDEHLEAVPVGEVGTLWIGGAGVAMGYVNDPEQTTSKFRPLTPGDNERFYNTGDLGRQTLSGDIVFVGRNDRQVKFQGFRIELGEIESAVRQHASVTEAVLIHSQLSDQASELVAFYTATEKITPGELIDHLTHRLPRFMLPSRVRQLDKIPLTKHGKVDFGQLQLLGEDRSRTLVKPGTPLESLLTDVWVKVLGRQVSVHDDFFLSGGDSIKAMLVVGEMLKHGYNLDVQDVFTSPRIVDLAGKLTHTHVVQTQEPVIGDSALSPVQIDFFDKDLKNPNIFNQSVTLTLKKDYKVERIEKALKVLHVYHDALGSTFSNDDQRMIQRFGEDQHSPLIQVFQVNNVADPDVEIADQVKRLNETINLSEGPLMACGLYREEDQTHLYLTIHHLVVDAVSWQILLSDLNFLLTQEKHELHFSKSSSYKEWVSVLNSRPSFFEQDAHKAYWQQFVNAYTRTAELFPASKAWVGINSSDIQFERELTNELSAAIKEKLNANFQEVLLTSISRAFHEVLSVDSLTVLLETHGRDGDYHNLDISRTVGWFTAKYPVMIGFENHSVVSHLINVKEKLRQVPYKGVGFGVLRSRSEDLQFSQVLNSVQPEIQFNFLGDLDSINAAISLGEAAEVRLYSEEHLSKGLIIDISAFIKDGQLRVTFNYSNDLNSGLIRNILEVMKKTLHQCLDECKSIETRLLSPSDLSDNTLLTIPLLHKVLERYDLEQVYPLTLMQKNLLVVDHSKDHEGTYFQQLYFEVSGHLSSAQLEGALDILTVRHESLRAVFVDDIGEEPLQVILKEQRTTYQYTDIQHLQQPAQQDFIEASRVKARKIPFVLDQGPLLRLSVFQLAPERYAFLWDHPHILMDGWSLRVLIPDFFQTYDVLSRGKQVDITLKPNYKTFFSWNRSKDENKYLSYWKSHLSEYAGNVSVPFRKENRQNQYDNRARSFVLDRDSANQLRALGAANKVTLNTLFQSVWAITLMKYNQTTDVVFGNVTNGRPSDVSGIDEAVGLFINTIPFRVIASKGQTFTDLLQLVQSGFIEAQKNQFISLADIQGQSPIKSGLFDNILSFESFPSVQGFEQAFGLQIDEIALFEQTNYDFNLIIYPEEDVRVEIKYNGNSFDDDLIESVLQHIQLMIDQIIADPGIEISQIRLASVESEVEMLRSANRLNLVDADNMISLFEKQVELSANATALDFEGAAMTYAELNQRANQLALQLRNGFQAGREDKIGISLERGIEMIIGILGILKSGAAYVPIDPALPEARIRHIAKDASLTLMLTAGQSFSFLDISVLDISGIHEHALDKELCNVERVNQPTDLAYIIYTSGSTGNPKGVMVTHQNVVNLMGAKNQFFDFNQQDTWTLFHSFSFDFSVWEIFGSLFSGSKLVILPSQVVLDPFSFYQYLISHKVTVLNQVPSSFANLLNAIEPEDDFDKLSIRYVIFGGEALKPEVLSTWKSAYPYCKLINMYGITETTIHVSFHEVSEEDILNRRSNIGKSLSGMGLFVMDESNHMQGVGGIGELYVTGGGLARGYINAPELTANRFFPHPKYPEYLIYKTGDLATYLPNGDIMYLGRSDNQVKIRGYRIELGEVENKINEFQSIRQAVVLPAELDEKDRNAILVGFFVSDERISIKSLLNHLKSYLPAHMVPSACLQVKEMPLTQNSKIDKSALLALFNNSKLSGNEEGQTNIPRDEIEDRIRLIWESVLKTPIRSLTTNFFELGGHSLSAAKVINQIKRELQITINIRVMLSNPSITSLSQEVRMLERAKEDPIVAVSGKTHYPLSYSQRGIWSALKLFPDRNYNVPVMIKLMGKLEVTRVSQAIEAVLMRHQILRTRLVLKNGEPTQQIADDVRMAELFDFQDWQGNPDLSDEVQAMYNKLAFKPFDLNDPLIRFTLIKCEEDQYRLVLVLHHLICDGESFGVLLSDFERYYQLLDPTGEGHELPILPIQYKDYAEWQVASLNTGKLRKAREFWLSQFEAPIHSFEFPFSMRSVTPKPSAVASVSELVLDQEVFDEVKKLSYELNVSVFVILMSVYKGVLYRLTRQRKLIVGSPVSSRASLGLEDQIGDYVNMIALTSEPSNSLKFADFVDQLNEKTLSAFLHQEYPFYLLQKELKQEGILKPDSELLSVGFTWHNYISSTHSSTGSLKWELVDIYPDSLKSKFWLHGYQNENNMNMKLLYDGSLFNKDEMNLFLLRYKGFLSYVCKNPDQVIGAVEMEAQESKQTTGQDFQIKLDI